MTRKYALSWDPNRPVLHEFLGDGVWSAEDDAAYLALLADVLKDAPAGGFDVISDARTFLMQKVTSSDEPAMRSIADAGGRRFVVVVSSVVIAMQASRVIREAVGDRLEFHYVQTMEEADAIVG